MKRILEALAYLRNFVKDSSFQWEQKWVRDFIGFCKTIANANQWTMARFPGGFLTIYANSISPILGITVFLFFAFTDWIDGKVARMQGTQGVYGALLDGIADKIFILPIIWQWGKTYTHEAVICVLFVIEGGGNFLIWLLSKSYQLEERRNILERKYLNPDSISTIVILGVSLFFLRVLCFCLIKLRNFLIFIPQDKDELYEHLNIGKYKFSLQVVFVCVLWLSSFVFPGSIWWGIAVNILFWIVTVLALFSVLCKINYIHIRMLPHFVTAGNMFCGMVAMLLGYHGQIEAGVALIVVATFFDAVDGYMARTIFNSRMLRAWVNFCCLLGLVPWEILCRMSTVKKSKFGDYADDVADFFSFALAPACLLYWKGLKWEVCVGYAIATSLRLIYFTFEGKIKRFIGLNDKVNPSGIFSGVPSPAAAIFVSGIILYGKISMDFMEILVWGIAIMEVLFVFKWYHFRLFSGLPGMVKIGLIVFFVGEIMLGRVGESFIFLVAFYLLFFSKKVADRFWNLAAFLEKK
jgi:phosphatidylserine synthase